MKKFTTLLILFSIVTFSQQSEVVTVVGDSLVGKTVNGENIREVIGNVIITQGDVIINCNKAIQYLSKNEIELIGDVIATQDTLVIKSEKGYYFGDNRIAQSDTTIYLSQPGMDLKANRGKYYFNDEFAQFFGNIVLNDSSFTLTSNELYYFKKDERVNAKTNVQDITEMKQHRSLSGMYVLITLQMMCLFTEILFTTIIKLSTQKLQDHRYLYRLTHLLQENLTLFLFLQM